MHPLIFRPWLIKFTQKRSSWQMFSVHSKQQKSLVKSLENISTSLLKEMKALNVYQINLIRTLKLMHKTKYGINPVKFPS